MLRIHPQYSAADVKRYFDVADYYSEGQETVGRFGGKLCRTLGIEPNGLARKEIFDLLCDNRRPDGSRLTLRTNDHRRVGYDFVFSGPKSFSLLVGLADDAERRELQAIFNAAVDETMTEHVEPDMLCRVRRDGANFDRASGNAIWAVYGHTTARPVEGQPPDPHWHNHVFVFSATEDVEEGEGRIKAGQFGDLKKDGEFYTAVFYAKLAAKLQAHGYALDKSGGKEWEIKGITPAMIATFNKRTDEIEAEHRRRLRDDPDYRPEYKYELAARTRGGKQKELTPAELRDAWRSQLSDADRDALAAVYRGRGHNGGPKVSAAEAVAFAVEHCFYREAVVSEKKLVATALLYGLGDVTAEAVRAAFAEHGVIVSERDGRAMATTEAAYAMERSYVTHAMNGRGRELTPPGPPEGLGRGILDDEQWAAVQTLLSSHDKVQLVDSAAGVGKSTMLSVYARGLAMAGRHATFLATTTPAVDVLRQDGFDAETLAKFLLSEKMQDAAKGGIVVLDEASFLGLRDAYRLFKICKDNDINLVLLGDSRQHAAVAAGGGAVMRTLREYAYIEPIRIMKIKRQRNADHREAVGHLAEGRVLDAFDILDQKLGWVHQIADGDERYAALAAAYLDGLKSGIAWDRILVSSPTHAEGQRAVDAIRSLLRQEKLIGWQDVDLTRWVAADLSDAEKADARTYRAGRVDMVQFFQHAEGHRSGSRVMIDREGVSHLPFAEAAKFQAYRRETVAFAEGDVIRFTANGTTLDGHRLRNGSRYRIAGFTATGIRLDNGWLVSKDFGHWRHGIETSHSSQSKSPELFLSAVSSQSLGVASSEMEYVDASRARLKALFFTDDKDGLRKAIQRSSLKLAAHDLVHGRTPEQAARWQRQHEASRRAMLERNRADAEAMARRRARPQPEPPRPLPPSPPASGPGGSHAAKVKQQQSGKGFGYGR